MSAVIAAGVSVREQIIAAILQALNTDTPPGVPQCVDTRFEPYTAEELPAMDLKVSKDDVSYEKLGKWNPFRKRVLTIRLSHSYSGPRSSIDPSLVWATQTIDGTSLAPLVEDAIEGMSEWTYAGLDLPYSVIHQEFHVSYHTVVGDQTRAD